MKFLLETRLCPISCKFSKTDFSSTESGLLRPNWSKNLQTERQNSFWLQRTNICVLRCEPPFCLSHRVLHSAEVERSNTRIIQNVGSLQPEQVLALCLQIPRPVWPQKTRFRVVCCLLLNLKSWDHPGNFCTNEHRRDKADQRAETIRQSFNSRGLMKNPQIFLLPLMWLLCATNHPLSNH